MPSSPEPKPVHAMTAAERRDLLRRRTPAGTDDGGMEIGGRGPARRVFALAGRLMALAALATLLVAMFYRFTASWRVAMIVVGLMLTYMLVVGRMVEGDAGRIE